MFLYVDTVRLLAIKVILYTMFFMESLSLFIESLGLNKKETQIYLSCLQYGLVTATTLSRISKIPRSSIYEITMKLIQQGFLAQHKKQVTSYFSATKPENLISILINQKEQIEKKIVWLESHLDELRNLSQYTGQIPKVQYYEGQEALFFFFEQIANAKFSYSVFDVESLIGSIYGNIQEYAILCQCHFCWHLISRRKNLSWDVRIFIFYQFIIL